MKKRTREMLQTTITQQQRYKTGIFPVVFRSFRPNEKTTLDSHATH